jgi:alpha-glucosidase
MALLLALRGTVFLYQGEELGLPQSEVPFERMQDPFGLAHWPLVPGRDGCRTPMPWQHAAPQAGFSTVEPWLPVDPAHAALAVDAQEAAPASMLHHTRALLRLRRAEPALRHGASRVLAADGDVLWLQRGGGPSAVQALFNLGAAPAPWPPMCRPEAAARLWSTTPAPTPDAPLPGGAAAFYRAAA